MQMPTAFQDIDPPEWIKWVIGWIGSGLLGLLGGWDTPLTLMFWAGVFNHFFGIAAAIKTREGFQPKKLATGIGIWVCYWVAVAVAFNVDQYFEYMGQSLPIRLHDAAVLGFFTADTVSSLANAALCGVPLPKRLMEGIKKLQDLAGETQVQNP
jgi:phage-related holin